MERSGQGRTNESIFQAFQFTQIVNAVRGLLLNHPDTSTIWLAITWCIGILVVFIPLAVWAYGRRTAR